MATDSQCLHPKGCYFFTKKLNIKFDIDELSKGSINENLYKR